MFAPGVANPGWHTRHDPDGVLLKERSTRCWYASAALTDLQGPFSGWHFSPELTLTGRYVFRFRFDQPTQVQVQRWRGEQWQPMPRMNAVGAEEAAQVFEFTNETVRIGTNVVGTGLAEFVGVD